MSETEVIQWSDELSVNVKEIDEQHQHFIEIINKLYQASETDDVNDTIDDIFDDLNEYIELHLQTEEKYFDMFDYEFTEEHKREHQELRNRLAELNEKKAIRDIKVYIELITFLQGWLQNHLITQDKKYTSCFNEHGLY